MSLLQAGFSHPALVKLQERLEADGVPLEKLKESFVLVNKEVLRHAELVEVMGAVEIGLVTQAAQKLRNLKLAVEAKPKAKAKAKSVKAQLAAKAREATKAAAEAPTINWDEMPEF